MLNLSTGRSVGFLSNFPGSHSRVALRKDNIIIGKIKLNISTKTQNMSITAKTAMGHPALTLESQTTLRHWRRYLIYLCG